LLTRSRWLIASLVVVAAGCHDDSTAPAPSPVDELPEASRGEYSLLVEQYTRAGERGYYTVTPSGSFAAAFDAAPRDARHLYPSPDGRSVAYLRETDDLVHLWLMDRDGTHARALADAVPVVEHAAWSPDGRRLALEGSSLESTTDIWVVGADGGGLRDLTPDPTPAIYYDRAPAWSPDGGRIAFSSTRTGINRLWVMNADGAAMRQVMSPQLEGTQRAPAWSPDGQLIAFAGATPTASGIGVVRPDGSGFHLYPVQGDAGSPAWLPDGRLVFSSNWTGNYELYALDLSSGGTTNLTNHRDHDMRAAVLRWVAPAPWLGLAAPARYATGRAGSPGIAAGDVDADGRPDAVVLSPALSELRVLRGSGGGVLTPLGSLDAAGEHRALVVANVTREPTADVVVLGRDAFSVWRGGSGGPGAQIRSALSGEAHGLAVTDLDGDGRLDVVTVSDRPGSGFHLVVHSVGADDQMIAILDGATSFTGAGRACGGDATGEGYSDLVVLTASTSAPIVLFPGQGDITFAAAIVSGSGIAVDTATIPLCVDLDGDRRSDLALFQPGAAQGLTLLRSTGAGFGAPTSVAVTGSAIAAADLDRDGDVDLLVASPATKSVAFLRNLGDGRLAPPTSLPLGAAPTQLAVADLDGDGWPDVLAIDAGGTVLVSMNRGRDSH
jgi:dipeptidyl aminopeptidase/acylaminoacyl peptidase